MKNIVQKVLESGLVDVATAKVMERMQVLPPGASQQVQRDALKSATRDALESITAGLTAALEADWTFTETYLDLKEQTRPVTVRVQRMGKGLHHTLIIDSAEARVDRFGRYFVPILPTRDPSAGFIPGYMLYEIVPILNPDEQGAFELYGPFAIMDQRRITADGMEYLEIKTEGALHG